MIPHILDTIPARPPLRSRTLWATIPVTFATIPVAFVTIPVTFLTYEFPHFGHNLCTIPKSRYDPSAAGPYPAPRSLHDPSYDSAHIGHDPCDIPARSPI